MKHLLGDPACVPIELCNLLENSCSFVVTTAVEEEFRRLAKAEDDEAEQKASQSYATDGKERVPPAHVVLLAATCGWLKSWVRVAAAEGFRSRPVRDASVLGYESVRYGSADDNSDRLEY